MSSQVADLWVLLRANTSGFRAEMMKAGAEADTAMSTARKAVIGAGGVIAGALGVAGFEALKMGSNFQASMQRVNTLAMGGKGNIQQLSQSVLQLAGQVGYDPDSLAQALYHIESNFYSVGLGGKQALDALKVAAQGAQIGGADLVDVTNALGAAVASGIPGVQDYRAAMKQLLDTVGSGDMTMQNLADAFSTGLLAIGKQYGATLQDMDAALATFGDNNIRGQKAATDLRMSIMDLTKQGKPGIAALQSIGIASGQLATDMQQGGLNKAIVDLRDHLKAAGIEGTQVGQFLEEAFTKKSSAPLAVLMGQFDRLQSKYKVLNAGAADFGNAWDSRLHTLQQQVDDTKARFESWLTSIGLDLMPMATQALDDMNKGFDWLGKHHDVVVALGGAVGGLLVPAVLAAVAAVGAFVLAAAPFVAVGAAIAYMVSRNQSLLQYLVVGLGAAAAAFGLLKGAELAWIAIQGAAAIAGEVGAFLSLIPEIGSAADAWVMLSTAMEATPIGAVAGAVGILAGGMFALFHAFGRTSPAVAAYNTAMKQVREATGPTADHIRALAGTYGNLRNKITKATYAMVEQDLERSGALKAAAKMGISELTLADAALGHADAIKVVNQALAAQREKLAQLRNANVVTASSQQVAASSAGHLTEQTGKAVAQYSAWKGKVDALSTSIDQVSGALAGETATVKDANTSWKNAQLAASDAAGAFDTVKNKAELINQPLAKNKQQIAELAIAFGLSARQIKTVMTDEAVPGTVQSVQKIIASLQKANDFKFDLSNVVASWTTQAAGLAATAHGDGTTIGHNLGTGFIGGIQAMISGVVAQARTMAASASQAAKNQLKMRSPSRVFHDIGLNVGQGLVNGMDESVGSVHAAAGRLSAATTWPTTGHHHKPTYVAHHKHVTGLQDEISKLYEALTHERVKLRHNVSVNSHRLRSEHLYDKTHVAALQKVELARYAVLERHEQRLLRLAQQRRRQIDHDPHATAGERKRAAEQVAMIRRQMAEAHKLRLQLLEMVTKIHEHQKKAHGLHARRESAKKAIQEDLPTYLSVAAAAGMVSYKPTSTGVAAGLNLPGGHEPTIHHFVLHTDVIMDGHKVAHHIQKHHLRHERRNTSNGLSARRGNQR